MKMKRNTQKKGMTKADKKEDEQKQQQGEEEIEAEAPLVQRAEKQSSIPASMISFSSQFTFTSLGQFHSCYKLKYGTPRQGKDHQPRRKRKRVLTKRREKEKREKKKIISPVFFLFFELCVF